MEIAVYCLVSGLGHGDLEFGLRNWGWDSRLAAITDEELGL